MYRVAMIAHLSVPKIVLVARPLWNTAAQKGIVPHGFHKLTVAFSSISPSQYGYFDVLVGTPATKYEL